jgi:BirA family transcriptional regulator, biotin operon repressor / biotin---[acetyl-CoA-carboxylase] ligase
VSRPDPLPPDIADALDAAHDRLGPFARVHYHADVASTNDLALTLAASGADHGTSVLADVQRSGRGRRGRVWFSPAGSGIYLSVVLRPSGPASALSLVTLAAGIAAGRGVRASSGLPVELKWPNDLVIGRPWRKLGGVLCEAVGSGGAIGAIVVGVGINVLREAYPRELSDRATSIETELGRSIDRGPVIVQVLHALRDVGNRLFGGGDGWVRDEWRRLGRAGLAGRMVRWQGADAERRGAARDIAADGALLVDVDGREERVIAGEVVWEPWTRE